MLDYTYYLTARPIQAGAYPLDHLKTVTDHHDTLADGHRLTGRLVYTHPLPRDQVTRYELMDLPLAQTIANILPPLESDWDWHGQPVQYGTAVRYLVFDLLTEYDRYFHADPRDDCFVLDKTGRVRFDRRALANMLTVLPAWSRWMVQFIIMGCPCGRFDLLDEHGVIRECKRILKTGEYPLIVRAGEPLR